MTPRTKFALAASVLLFLVAAGALAYTKRPWADEAWFANTSVNLIETGKTGISVLHPKGNANMLGREFPGINREFYIWIPAQQAVYSLWYRLVGFSVLTMRTASILWGLLALVAWFVIVRSLTASDGTATLAVLLIGTDFAMLDAASDGRMDMMCAALNFGGLATYLFFREQRLNAAILTSQALVVTAGLTHPMGAVGFITLLVLTLWLDRSRLRWRHVVYALLVYACGVAVIAAYVLPGLPLFKAQLGGALTGRLGMARSFWNTVARELSDKFAGFYWPPYASGAALLRLAIPCLYAAAAVGGFFLTRSRPGHRTLWGMALVALGTMAVLDSGKLPYYLVHSTTYLAALLAVTISLVWESGRNWARVVVSLASGAVLLLHLAWVAWAVRKDPYHQSFLPMARFVQNEANRHTGQPFLIQGSAELGFVLGFRPPLSDDALLGYGSGQRGDLVVMDERSYKSHYRGFEQQKPEIAAHMKATLEQQSTRAWGDGYYEIYLRQSPEASRP